jgi:hypothetical protein
MTGTGLDLVAWRCDETYYQYDNSWSQKRNDCDDCERHYIRSTWESDGRICQGEGPSVAINEAERASCSRDSTSQCVRRRARIYREQPTYMTTTQSRA